MNKVEIFPEKSFKYRGLEVNLDTLVENYNNGRKYNFRWPDCSSVGDIWSIKFKYKARIEGPRDRLTRIINLLSNDCINPYVKENGITTRLGDGHLYHHDKSSFKCSFYSQYGILLTMESYVMVKGKGKRSPRKINAVMSFACLFEWASDYIREKIFMSENNSVQFLLEDEQK